MPRALIVTITEGVELLPQAAFISSALRQLGFDPRVLPTDFCTTQDSFQTAVQAADPAAVVFFDAVEWREVLVTLSGFACNVTKGPVLIATALPQNRIPTDFPGRSVFVQDGDLASLARALGVEPRPIDVASLGLDYDAFDGGGMLRRAMSCSLFGDVGTIGLLASRPAHCGASPTAALARLEGPVSSGPVLIQDTAVLQPVGTVGRAGHAVEWWDRSLPSSRWGLLEEATALGVAEQTVRLLAVEATPAALRDLRTRGATRVVFECDALDDVADVRLPGAAGTASEVAAAVERVRGAGLEAGALLVIGLPGETADVAAARCGFLRSARLDRVRVVPFEPTGGTEAWDWCVARRLWPPAKNRWNRELYQPLMQPASADHARVLEEALMLLADVESRSGVST